MPHRLAIVGNQAFSMLNFRAEFIATAASKGVEVFALAPDFTEAQKDQVRALGATPCDFRMQRTGMNPFADSITFLSLVSVLRRLKPKTVLSYAIKPAIYGTLAASVAQVPNRFALIEGLGHVFLSPQSFKGNIVKALALKLYRSALSRADCTLFLNSDDQNDFVALQLVDPARTELLGPIGIDLETWVAQPAITDPVTFLFVGRLLKEKGIMEFIAAARQVKDRYRQARFIVLGDVDSNPSSISRDQIAGWTREGLVEWPGHVAVASWLAQSSVFVLPSYREGVPRSTQEAMAAGRPVITTDVPGCRTTVIDRENGLLVPVRDVEALAAAMMEFLEQPCMIVEMGQRSRQMAETMFDVRESNRRLLSMIGL